MNRPAINLVIALPPEAKPINQHLGLQRDQRHGEFALYRHQHISLVISGPGRNAAAAAVKWMHSINPGANAAIWINLGIAGHPEHRIGEIFMANRIEDRENGQGWDLALSGDFPCHSERVISVAEPDVNYGTNALMEMEASGFYPTALQYADADRIYCFKVVSDNREHPANQINGKLVSHLIRQRLDILDLFLSTLSPNRGDR